MNKRFFDKLLDILYPEDTSCWLCGMEKNHLQNGICTECSAKLNLYDGIGSNCKYDGFRAGLFYDEAVMKAMHRFKYSGETYLAKYFAHYMNVDKDWDADIIAPVPLHTLKRMKRGYNQSACLARLISEKSSVPTDETILRRTKYTSTQTKLNSVQRMENTHGAFLADKSANGKRIILIDDVRTTGSTLNECARALYDVGAIKVFALCACATDEKIYLRHEKD